MGNKYINRVNTINEVNKILTDSKRNIVCLNYNGTLREISKFKCLIDGYEWETSFDSIKNSKCGCPKCSKLGRIKTLEQVNEWLKSNNKEIECLYYAGTVINKNSRFKCLIDNYEWTSSFNNIKNNHRGCAKCVNLARINSIDEVNEWLVENKKDFICIDYMGTVTTKSLFRCLKDNHEWYSSFNHIKNGNGCPLCSFSHGELKILNYLNTNNIKHRPQYKLDNCRDILPLPFDVAIFKNNKLLFLCEYQGVQHYEPVDFANKGMAWAKKMFKNTNRHDEIKRNYCLSNNIKLLTIPYWDYKNIEKILDMYMEQIN